MQDAKCQQDANDRGRSRQLNPRTSHEAHLDCGLGRSHDIIGISARKTLLFGIQSCCSERISLTLHVPLPRLFARPDAAGHSVPCHASRQVRVKMVTADDDSVTDIVVEGDREELERMSKVGWGRLGGGWPLASGCSQTCGRYALHDTLPRSIFTHRCCQQWITVQRCVLQCRCH